MCPVSILILDSGVMAIKRHFKWSMPCSRQNGAVLLGAFDALPKKPDVAPLVSILFKDLKFAITNQKRRDSMRMFRKFSVFLLSACVLIGFCLGARMPH